MGRGPAGAIRLCSIKELRRRARSWFGLAIILGVLGGATTFGVVGASRTDSAFGRLADLTLAPDLYVAAECSDETCVQTADKLSALPSIIAAAPAINYLGAMTTPSGRPLSIGDDACYTGSGEIDVVMAADGRWGSTVNRFDLEKGSLPDPASTEQVLIASGIARRFNLRVGDQISLHGDACDQEGPAPPARTLRVVGIERSTIEQQPEVGFYILGVHGTPALYRALRDDGIKMGSVVALRIAAHTSEAQVIRQASAAGIHIEPIIRLQEIRSGIAKGTRPDSLAIFIIGMFAALAALVVIGPALIQHAAATGPELRTLKILGLTGFDVIRIGLMTGLIVGFASALICGIVAVALSPLSPIGEARQMDPSLGVFVSPYLGLGMAATTLAAAVLTTLGTVFGARRERIPFRSVSAASRLVRTLHFRPPTATGVRMALEWRGSTSALALVGVMTGLAGLIAALTFGSSVDHLDRTPSLVGWNWDMAAFLSGSDEDAAPEPLADMRDRFLAIPGVREVSLATFFPPQFSLLGDNSYPIAFSTGVDSIYPTVIEGRAPAGSSEVLLSVGLARRLHLKVGDRAELRRADPTDPDKPSGSTTPFQVVGIGVLPIADGRIDLGLGLTLDGLVGLVPGFGPHVVLLNLDPGTDPKSVKAALEQRPAVQGVIDRAPQSSKLIQLDTGRVASTPRIVAVLFAGTAAAVLIHGVITSGRKRRRELAIFKAIGFTARQTTAASVWQAGTATLVAVALSVPIGSAVGAGLWSLYAESLGVKVHVSTSALGIGSVVAGSLAGAAIVAFWPAWLTSRRATANTLRAE